MQVKKCIALFASAAFAMLTLAGCGGSDHSELAARTVNEAQKEPISVEFTTDKDLTQSLKDALKDTTDPSKLVSSIQADEDLADLLTGVQVGAYTADSQLSPEEAAQQIAERILTNLSGKQDKGYITMVEAEDGTYYAIILVYGSGSGSGSGSGNDSGGNTNPDPTPEPEPEPTPDPEPKLEGITASLKDKSIRYIDPSNYLDDVGTTATLEASDLTVTASYTEGDPKNVFNFTLTLEELDLYNVKKITFDSADTYIVTVSYTTEDGITKEDTVEVTVKEVELESITFGGYSDTCERVFNPVSGKDNPLYSTPPLFVNIKNVKPNLYLEFHYNYGDPVKETIKKDMLDEGIIDINPSYFEEIGTQSFTIYYKMDGETIEIGPMSVTVVKS